MVGLNEKRAVGKHVAEQVALGIDGNLHAVPVEPRQNLLVNIIRERGRDAACQNQVIALPQAGELFKKPVQSLRRNVGPLAVDLGLAPGLDFYIDAGEPGGQLDKIHPHAGLCESLCDGPAGKARQKAQRDIFDA